MNSIKRITRAFSAWLLAFSLFALASFTALTITILNPAFIKATLVKTDTYQHVVPSILHLATNVSYQQQPGEISNSQTLDELIPIIEKSITPAFIQTSTEAVINGTYGWLKGTYSQPTFSVDISVLKSALVTNLTDYLVQRVNALPTCSKTSTPPSFDPVNATCKPAVSFSREQIQTSALEFVNSFPALASNQITVDKEYAAKTFAPDKPISKVPAVYFWLTKALYIFAGLVVASILTIIVLSNEKRKVWRTMGHTLVLAGILLIVTAAVTYLLLNRFGHQFIGSASKDQLEFVNTIFSPLSQELSKSLANVALIFGVTYSIIGAVFYAIAHKLDLDFKKSQPEISEN
ncbi:MAG: hypothetical protein U0491_00860 [Candidatus Saccharimonadales bacterium]